MKFHQYWVRESGNVTIGGRPQTVACYGGSDASVEDARQAARRKIEAVQRKLDGEPDAFAGYEVAIREEVVRVIDSKNLVSRTRYGALILNSEDTFFIDIDKPPLRLWKSLFAWRGLPAKERIAAHIAELAQTPPYSAYGIRLYETHSGIRAIVSGAGAPPDSSRSNEVLKKFHADPLYAALCRKQGCYRARLTPKPQRVQCRAFRVEFPRDETAQAALDAWLAEYEAKSSGHAVCRFLREFGRPHRNAIIDLHDRLTEAHSRFPLA